MTNLLDGLPDPRNPPDAQAYTRLDRFLIHQLKTYDIDYPLVKQEKAAPLGIIHSIVAAVAIASNPKTRQVTDLVTLGFYFCLSMCEYTKSNGHRQIFQLRPHMDSVFFVVDRLLPANSPIKHYQHAIQIVLTLDNQKNAIQGESVSHF